jgi:hypothetical protein
MDMLVRHNGLGSEWSANRKLGLSPGTGPRRTAHLSLTTMPSGAYAFEISDIQEDQAEGVLSQATRMECYTGLKTP